MYFSNQCIRSLKQFFDMVLNDARPAPPGTVYTTEVDVDEEAVFVAWDIYTHNETEPIGVKTPETLLAAVWYIVDRTEGEEKNDS